jgi:hypothetical protein
MCNLLNYLILFLLLITCYLYYLKTTKDNESFINEYTNYCGSINDQNKCNNNPSCFWNTISGQTVANGNTQSYSFCDVKNQS